MYSNQANLPALHQFQKDLVDLADLLTSFPSFSPETPSSATRSRVSRSPAGMQITYLDW